MKILSNLIISGGWLRPNGDAAQVGDSVRLYLDDGTEIVGTIEFPIAVVNCGQDRTYRVAYDREEIIRAGDVIDGVILDSNSLLEEQIEVLEERVEILETQNGVSTAETEIALGSAGEVLDSYLETVLEDSGNGMVLAEYTIFKNADNEPINVYTNAGATVPALLNGDVIESFKDPVSGSRWVRFQGTSVLRFDDDGRPYAELTGASFGAQDDIEGVTALWSVFKKGNATNSNGLLGYNIGPAYWGTWGPTEANGIGLGFAIAGGNTNGLEASRDTIANDESRLTTGPRLEAGFIYDGQINYSVNGRNWKAADSLGIESGIVNVIGFNAGQSIFALTGNLYGFGMSKSPVNLTSIDKINSKFANDIGLVTTSAKRRLIVTTGTSMDAPDGTAGPNNSIADYIQRGLGNKWRVENTAIGGAQTPELMEWNREAMYDRTQPKICYIGGIYNQIAGVAEDRTAEASLASHHEYYLQLKALGYTVFNRTLYYRADLDGVTGAVSIPEFARRVDFINEIWLQKSSIGYYHDVIEDMTQDELIMDPLNAAYRPDLVHGSALWTARVANVYDIPTIKKFVLNK